MKLSNCEYTDGLLLEWIDKNKRFGIALENEAKKSSWYFVQRLSENDHITVMENDYIDIETLEKIYNQLKLILDK
jgi:hypothetical protein